MGELRILKELKELRLEPLFGGWLCQDTDGFINEEMLLLFDGVTVREFEIPPVDTGGYTHGYKRWWFHEEWFDEGPDKNWLSEEDFAL